MFRMACEQMKVAVTVRNEMQTEFTVIMNRMPFEKIFISRRIDFHADFRLRALVILQIATNNHGPV